MDRFGITLKTFFLILIILALLSAIGVWAYAQYGDGMFETRTVHTSNRPLDSRIESK